MRQIIISICGILLVAGAFFTKKYLADSKKDPTVKTKPPIPTVFTDIVKNGDTPITVTASGNLAALNRIELFAEVQGIFEHSANIFEPGIGYKKGSVLMRINSDEHRANLRSQKSNLYNQIVAALPDLKFDYPDAAQRWEQYVADFDVNATLSELPKTISDKEKLFIAGRNINSTWYAVKNLEERLSKYTIYAPFSGVLTEALVDRGALIRAGQKLGEFINPNIYELEVAVNSAYADILKVGKPVTLHNIERTKTWTGKVHRLNPLIDPNSQSVKAYIQLSGKDLREGQYLEADLTAKEEANTYEVSRKLIVDNDKIFVLRDTLLSLVTIEPVYFKEKTVVVRGLEDGWKVINKSVPGGYDGMVVKEL